MKQAMLRVKGRRANRKVALDVLLDEATKVKHDHIKEQFDKLAEKHMFLRDPEATAVEAYLHFRAEQAYRKLTKNQQKKVNP